MKKDPFRTSYLIAGYIRNTLTDTERDELDEWVVASDANMKLFAELTDENKLQQSLLELDSIDKNAEWQKLLSRIPAGQPQHSRKFWIYAAAAIIIIVAGLFFINRYTTFKKDKPVPGDIANVDIQPGGSLATLTLEDGQVIDLGAASIGILPNSAGGEIYKMSDDALNYKMVKALDGETVYHQLAVPKGGRFSVTLSDGTKVWLNAASSLRYPGHFSDSVRIVELNGEGYFEVAKNAIPFRVKTPGQHDVKVLGTHFNVKAYTDEDKEVITLLEGSVEVKANTNTLKLAPGEQTRITGDKMVLDKSADIDEVIAWKMNTFKFNDAPIEEIMKQVERWYNAEIVYETKTTHHFNATIARDKPVSKLLRYLELTGNVHFKIEKNKIIVMK